jgi:hypothetical protein
MISADTNQIQQNVSTEIKLTSDHGNYVALPPGAMAPTFTISGTGGTIVSQYILDAYNALVTVLGTTDGVTLTITDPKNGEAVSVAVHSVASLQAEVMSEGDPVSEAGTPGDNVPPPAADVPT